VDVDVDVDVDDEVEVKSVDDTVDTPTSTIIDSVSDGTVQLQPTSNKTTLIMGIISEEIGSSVTGLFSPELNNALTTSYYTVDKLKPFVRANVTPRFRFTNDNFINQRLAIYSQLYETGGVYLNPSNVGINEGLLKLLDDRPTNIFLLLDREKSQHRCQTSAQKHSIRNGRSERRYAISAHFLYSKRPEHPFWTDLIRLSDIRYNQVVPMGEQIESISKYGQQYLAGSDLLSELVYQTQNKYDDVQVLTKELLAKMLTQTQTQTQTQTRA